MISERVSQVRTGRRALLLLLLTGHVRPSRTSLVAIEQDNAQLRPHPRSTMSQAVSLSSVINDRNVH